MLRIVRISGTFTTGIQLAIIVVTCQKPVVDKEQAQQLDVKPYGTTQRTIFARDVVS